MEKISISLQVDTDQPIGFILRGEFPCQLDCLSENALSVGFQSHDQIVSINGEDVQLWPHHKIAAFLFAQVGEVNICVQRQVNAVVPSPLATLAKALHINQQCQMPLNQSIQLIRSFDVPLTVLTCENALTSLRNKLLCWAKRPLSVSHNDEIKSDGDNLHFIRTPENSLLAKVPNKDVMIFGNLYSAPYVWALLTRGTRKRLGICLFHLNQSKKITKELEDDMHPIGYTSSKTKVLYGDVNAHDTQSESRVSVDDESRRESHPRLVPFNSLNSLISEGDITDPSVKLWSRSLSDLLSDPFGKHAFEKFLQSEYSTENIEFWTACNEFKYTSDAKERSLKAKQIWNRFLDSEAKLTVNIGSDVKHMCRNKMDNPSINLFNELQDHIYSLMKYDSYPRFLKSDFYKDCKNPLNKETTCVNKEIIKVVDDEDESPRKDVQKTFPMFHWARGIKLHLFLLFLLSCRKMEKQNKFKDFSNLKNIVFFFVGERRNASQSSIFQLGSCVLLFPSNIAVKVVINLSDKSGHFFVKSAIAPVLKRRGFVWYRTRLEDSITGQNIDFNDPVARISGRRIFVHLMCLLAFNMPDKRDFIVCCDFDKTVHDALLKVCRSGNYSYKIEKLHFATWDCDIQIISLDKSVSDLDNRCVAARIKPIKVTGFKHFVRYLILEPLMEYDIFETIPNEDNLINFDSHGVLQFQQAKKLSLNDHNDKKAPVNKNHFADVTIKDDSLTPSDDSLPVEFRRQKVPCTTHQNPSIDLPEQFIFPPNMVPTSSSVSSSDSLNQLTQFNLDDSLNMKEDFESNLIEPRNRKPFVENDSIENEVV